MSRRQVSNKFHLPSGSSSVARPEPLVDISLPSTSRFMTSHSPSRHTSQLSNPEAIRSSRRGLSHAEDGVMNGRSLLARTDGKNRHPANTQDSDAFQEPRLPVHRTPQAPQAGPSHSDDIVVVGDSQTYESTPQQTALPRPHIPSELFLPSGHSSTHQNRLERSATRSGHQISGHDPPDAVQVNDSDDLTSLQYVSSSRRPSGTQISSERKGGFGKHGTRSSADLSFAQGGSRSPQKGRNRSPQKSTSPVKPSRQTGYEEPEEPVEDDIQPSDGPFQADLQVSGIEITGFQPGKPWTDTPGRRKSTSGQGSASRLTGGLNSASKSVSLNGHPNKGAMKNKEGLLPVSIHASM